MSAKWYPVFLDENLPIGDGHEYKTTAELQQNQLLDNLYRCHAGFSRDQFETQLLTDEQVKEMRDDN